MHAEPPAAPRQAWGELALEFSVGVRYGPFMSRHHVVLVPGFFGFGSLGELTYFVGVRQALERAFERFSLNVHVVEVQTLPTASIRSERPSSRRG